MSGTDEFGTGGYGAGEFDRAAAESGPGAGPRVPAPAGANQGTGAEAVNGAPWLAGGAVPYAEAMFGAADQSGPSGDANRQGANAQGANTQGVGQGVGHAGGPAPQG
ncbi:MAG: hypothetical protein ACRDSS_11605, partial [Actinocrinis sp.]